MTLPVTYTTLAGDTWDIIAYRLYGDEYRMSDLQDANRNHLGTLVFGASVVLAVPAVETRLPSSLPPWKR